MGFVLAAALGLAIGWLDLQTTEVVVTVLALLVAGFLLGILKPRRAWRWALLLGLGLLTMAMIAQLLHVRTAEPVHLDPLIALVAFGFALVGCYGGVLVGWIAFRQR